MLLQVKALRFNNFSDGQRFRNVRVSVVLAYHF